MLTILPFQDLSQCLLGVVEPGFNGPLGDLQNPGDFLQGEILEEVEGQDFAVRERDQPERVMHPFRILKLVANLPGHFFEIIGRVLENISIEASPLQMGHRVVSRGVIEPGGQCSRFPEPLEAPENTDPGFLKKVPSILFPLHQAADVVEKGLFPSADQIFKRSWVSPAEPEHQEFAINCLLIGVQSIASAFTQQRLRESGKGSNEM
jgi:hypothetical protein